MSEIAIEKIPKVRGKISIPGDKSISHRAVMISSIAKGRSTIKGLLQGLDCQSTIEAFQKLGIFIKSDADGTVSVEGKGLRGLAKPDSLLYLGNSGTTMRLILGILAGQNFESILTGDESLSVRPMKRVTGPLRKMGAGINGKDDANLAPLTVKGAKLKSIDYNSPVASAQVKSAIMLAGLYADGRTTVTEPSKSRDHTERIFKLFGIPVEEKGLSVSIEGLGQSELKSQLIEVPGDISSAAFFIALGVLSETAEITIESCGINPTRAGIIEVLKRMNADITISNSIESGYEPRADLLIKSSSLKATKIIADEIPTLIDEIPVIALCASQADGETVIESAGELRVKETDRINSIVSNLTAMGANIQIEGDNIIIKGPSRLKGTKVNSFGDHRTAMMLVVAGAIAEAKTTIEGTDCIATSFPGFMEALESLTS